MNIVLIPIVKDKKGKHNYRPIIVILVLSNVFELVIFDKYVDRVYTQVRIVASRNPFEH